MGVDARWYCKTCKIVYHPTTYGGRNLWNYARPPHWRKLEDFITQGRTYIIFQSPLGQEFHSCLHWLEELVRFLKKHEGHEVVITSDLDGNMAMDALDWERP